MVVTGTVMLRYPNRGSEPYEAWTQWICSRLGYRLAALKTRSILVILVPVVAMIAVGEYYAGFGSFGNTTLNMQILGGVGLGTVDINSPTTSW
jgi:hypothetical protein